MLRSTYVAVALSGLFWVIISSCNGGNKGTPIDNDRARKHIIPIKQADSYIEKFSVNKKLLQEQLRDSSFLNTRFDLPISETFNSDAIALLLQQNGCKAVRIYFGIDADGKVRLVLLPVDNNGKDIRRKLINGLTSAAAQAGGDDGEAVEIGQRCPTMCEGLE